MTSVDFPPPDTPVMQSERANGKCRAHILQIVALRARDFQPAVVHSLAPFLRYRDLLDADEVASPVQELFGARMMSSIALGDDLAAMDAVASLAIVDLPRGRRCEWLLRHVHDDDDRVAKIAQALERLQKLRIVPLVQTDRRFVEHKHARQSGADLGGEPDALAFAARKCAGGARQRQVKSRPTLLRNFSRARISFQDARGDLKRSGCFVSCLCRGRGTMHRHGGSTARKPRRCACRRS